MAKQKNSKITEAVTRIQKMEMILDKLLDTISLLENCEDPAASSERLSAIKKDVSKLERYYEGRNWKADFALDEKGLLPADLKRGVLSEDGIYNVLTRYEELLDEMGTEEI